MAKYEARIGFNIPKDLKPFAGRDCEWLRFDPGDSVPEKVVKADPSLLDEIPGRGTPVVRVNGSEG